VSRRPGRQLLLDLTGPEAHLAEDFVVGPANARAHAFVAAWPDWPQHLAVLVGPPGSGKSHLAALWAVQSGARPGGAADAGTRAVLVEDADRDVRDETGLFHLVNLMAERGGHVLVTARRPPGAWGIGLADLASRLRAAPLVEIASPDGALLEAIMVKLFTDRQLDVEAGVVAYALARMERSPAAVRRLVAEVDRRSLEEQRRVTARLVGEVLEEWSGTGTLL